MKTRREIEKRLNDLIAEQKKIREESVELKSFLNGNTIVLQEKANDMDKRIFELRWILN